METLASPLNLDVSIKGVQNGNTTDQSAEGCYPIGHACGNADHDPFICCRGLKCSAPPRKCIAIMYRS